MKYEIDAIDSRTWTPAAGLSPVWVALKKASDLSDYTPQPAITEQALGLYAFDISVTERLIGRVDLGASLLAQDRYIEGIVLDPSDAGGGNVFTGSQPVVITVFQGPSTMTPIPEVFISVLNAAGTLVLGTVMTDNNGQTKDSNGNVTVMLDPTLAEGYTLSLRKAGVVFSSTPLTQAEVVAGTLTVYGTVFVPAVPVPGTQSLYGTVVGLDTVNSTDVVTAQIAYDGSEVQGEFVQNYRLSSTITAGRFSLVVPWDAQVVVTIPNNGSWQLTVSEDDYRDLADYVSKGEAQSI
jgi:hypothetical protein